MFEMEILRQACWMIHDPEYHCGYTYAYAIDRS
jgi:hypothetical protein